MLPGRPLLLAFQAWGMALALFLSSAALAQSGEPHPRRLLGNLDFFFLFPLNAPQVGSDEGLPIGQAEIYSAGFGGMFSVLYEVRPQLAFGFGIGYFNNGLDELLDNPLQEDADWEVLPLQLVVQARSGRGPIRLYGELTGGLSYQTLKFGRIQEPVTDSKTGLSYGLGGGFIKRFQRDPFSRSTEFKLGVRIHQTFTPSSCGTEVFFFCDGRDPLFFMVNGGVLFELPKFRR